MIKKILLFSCLIIIIPFIIVTIFIRYNEQEFNFSSNTLVRVLDHDTKTIVNVPIEEYVIGVVCGEMPSDFELEALKAQAVASRTYVMYQMKKNKNNDYDVVDTVMNQVYLSQSYLKSVWQENYDEKLDKIKNAVLSTKGEYVSYNDEIAETLFFSTSPGATENSEDVFVNSVAYLRQVDSKWDLNSPNYESIKKISLEDFYKKLDLKYNVNLNIEIIDKTSTGRVKKIEINNSIFTGTEIANKLSLKSSCFEINYSNNMVVISNKGYGHGVGMSQYGANGMAQEGYNYREILNHYYTNIEIKKY